jgi:Heterokaryon incompatibility protein (HET)
MRLLRRTDAGDFNLTEEFVGNTIVPPYAILSHTWGKDEDEVTFKDFETGAGRSKAGYGKIQFCGEQAARHGLQYFWIDTCCIDKSNAVELSEAINSMFRWYGNSQKCFVYLSDVSTCDYDENCQLSRTKLECTFRDCRWFTRGWTLQELIAPASVEFFSAEKKQLGDKKLLEQQIHETTGIPIEALQGSPLSRFTVEQRMSWAIKRETKREEDSAYSLMGVFNIYMPPIYGEGRENAFARLREEVNKRSTGK